jgi:alkylhydroperoxidase family enzyme
VLEDYRTAPIGAKLRATLALVEKVTLDHEHLGADDVRPVLAAGVSRAAVVDALYVTFLFNVFDRLADTLGWEDLSPERYAALGRRIVTRGYGR